jgi:hypothetical protein
MMVTSVVTGNHSTGEGIVGLLSYMWLLYGEVTSKIPVDRRMN